MQIQEDIDFLKAKREKGRKGCMAGADKILFEKEKTNPMKAQLLENDIEDSDLSCLFFFRKHYFFL